MEARYVSRFVVFMIPIFVGSSLFLDKPSVDHRNHKSDLDIWPLESFHYVIQYPTHILKYHWYNIFGSIFNIWMAPKLFGYCWLLLFSGSETIAGGSKAFNYTYKEPDFTVTHFVLWSKINKWNAVVSMICKSENGRSISWDSVLYVTVIELDGYSERLDNSARYILSTVLSAHLS